MPDLSWLYTTKPEPDPKPANIPDHAQWLSGEGAGSWFALQTDLDENIIITRFSPDGIVECKSFFECISGNDFSPRQPYSFIHLSHCKEVKISQNNEEFLLVRKARIV